MFTTVLMVRTVKGSPDGVAVREFFEGEIYDLPDSLAQAFLSMGAAELDKQTESINKNELETPETPKPRGRPRK
jgi:hypothetical protein